jgi:hypothetical protein
LIVALIVLVFIITRSEPSIVQNASMSKLR